jgi:hypothetical protein
MLTALTITLRQLSDLHARLVAAPVQDGNLIQHCITATEYAIHGWILDERALNARGICAAVINSEEWPRVELIDEQPNRREFKLVGGKLTDEWKATLRDGDGEPYCRIIVWNRATFTSNAGETTFSTVIGDCVSGFGGSVWPSAWPALFESRHAGPSVGYQTKLTKLGRELLVQACVAAKEKTS